VWKSKNLVLVEQNNDKTKHISALNIKSHLNKTIITFIVWKKKNHVLVEQNDITIFILGIKPKKVIDIFLNLNFGLKTKNDYNYNINYIYFGNLTKKSNWFFFLI